MLKIKSQDELDRRINNFAERSFRDIADGDYIAARLACSNELLDQFKWSALQAIEKYFKYILLVNRIPAPKIGHDITKALSLFKDLPFQIELSRECRDFISYISVYGEDRYLTHSWNIKGPILPLLDRTIWESRRYCQVLDVRGKSLPVDEEKYLSKQINELNISSHEYPHKFKLPHGLLEKILAQKNHPARDALIWNNLFFGTRHKATVNVRDFFQATNAPLWLYPQMHDELSKYVCISKTTSNHCKKLIEAGQTN